MECSTDPERCSCCQRTFIPMPRLPAWNSLREALSVSAYLPYSYSACAIGELLNHGWVWLALYCLVVGVIAAWVDIRACIFEGKS
jgi:hypothetical protein